MFVIKRSIQVAFWATITVMVYLYYGEFTVGVMIPLAIGVYYLQNVVRFMLFLQDQLQEAESTEAPRENEAGTLNLKGESKPWSQVRRPRVDDSDDYGHF